ncbi:MAG: hypothetical protein KDA20_11490 [Phycisphaerales bacterium]|nr:hypothetical protein [Phycisphaerales bacterium]
MHILTKFFVIIAAMLSVLLAGLSIAYTSNADALRQAVVTERMKAQEAAAAASAATAGAGEELAQVRDVLSAVEEEKRGLLAEVNKLTSEKTQLAADVKKLELASQGHDARIEEFTALVKAFLEQDSLRSNENQTLREKEIAYLRKEIELGERINELGSQLEVSQETNRTLQEQLADMRDRLGNLNSSNIASGAAFSAPRAPDGFRATVTGVARDAAGKMLVSIDAGLNDRLQKQMKLSIVRGSSWVGSMTLESVNLNDAVGVIDLSNLDVRAGDTVEASDAGW